MVLATVPADLEDVEVVFMGQTVRATSFAAEGFTDMIGAAGLTVLSTENVLFTPDQPGADPEPHLFVRCVRG